MSPSGSSLKPDRRQKTSAQEDISFRIERAVNNPLGFYDWILKYITVLADDQCRLILDSVKELQVFESKRGDQTETHAYWMRQLEELRFVLEHRLGGKHDVQ